MLNSGAQVKSRKWLAITVVLSVCTVSTSAAGSDDLTRFSEAYDSDAALNAYMSCVEAFGRPSKAKRECTKALSKNAELYNLGKVAIGTLEGLKVPNPYGFSKQEIRDELQLTKQIVNDLYGTIAEIYAWRGTNLITLDRDLAVSDCDKARRMARALRDREQRELITSLCF